MNQFVVLNQEVQEALASNKPVVALESTIISHGMPYPKNVEMANKVEDIIRQNGAVPATIAIMDGQIKVGLTPEDLEILATHKDVAKVSRRDLASILSQKKMGATTVAATMICANLAGIKFFVTGGIGGVHKGYEEFMDVSADLEELSQTDVTVICAGAKSILDLPRTLEYLETKGVPVIGYQTNQLPAFYTRESGYSIPLRMDETEDIAEFVKTKELLQLGGGNLVVNPIPVQHQLEPEYINSLIDQAVEESVQQHVVGKDITPFLLARIVELSEGKSLEANLQLVYHNALVGAQIAANYQKL